MKKWLTGCLALSCLALLLSQVEAQSLPAVPDTGTPQTSQAVAEVGLSDADHPARLIVPSIGLDAPIENVGKNKEGEMAVPDGSGDTVGWYEDGTTPGEHGSAVLAAHVYAAFSELNRLEPGADIFLVRKDGETLHFVAEESKLTWLQEVSGYFLFERSDSARLNLITCAGKFNRRTDTYEKRLIVYAKLVQ